MPMNYAKTALLLAALTAIFVAMGAAVGGQTGLVVAFIAALIMNVMSLWKSDTMVLKMFKAQEVDDTTAPELVSVVRTLSQRAGLPMPRVYIMTRSRMPSPPAAARRTPRSAPQLASSKR
jgi:heat shock protein HtpX